jgi:hypothetical protein
LYDTSQPSLPCTADAQHDHTSDRSTAEYAQVPVCRVTLIHEDLSRLGLSVFFTAGE